MVIHIGASTFGGHYVSYVLVEPGAILSRLKAEQALGSTTEIDPGLHAKAAEQEHELQNQELVEQEEQRRHCEPNIVADLIPTPSCQEGDDVEKDRSDKKDTRVWCYCSDQQVRLASAEEVLKAKAYLCFYEQC